jgi:hypothetical protein
LIQHRRLFGDESRSVQFSPRALTSGSKFDPEKKTIRFGSVPVVIEQ